jgi:tRNA dimethylallyltransferase
VRAIELALLTGHPLTHWQRAARAEGTIEPWYVRLTVPRPVLHRRIEVRARDMLQRGLVEEVASVLAEGHPAGTPGLDAVGVREAVQYLHGQRERETIVDAIAASTRQYAKRQETWFRHQLKGAVITLDATRPPAEVAREVLEAWNQNELAGA